VTKKRKTLNGMLPASQTVQLLYSSEVCRRMIEEPALIRARSAAATSLFHIAH